MRRWCGPLAAVPGIGWLARAIIGGIAPTFSAAHPKVRALLDYSNTRAGAYLVRRVSFYHTS